MPAMATCPLSPPENTSTFWPLGDTENKRGRESFWIMFAPFGGGGAWSVARLDPDRRLPGVVGEAVDAIVEQVAGGIVLAGGVGGSGSRMGGPQGHAGIVASEAEFLNTDN
jgi:hypothetical protein